MLAAMGGNLSDVQLRIAMYLLQQAPHAFEANVSGLCGDFAAAGTYFLGWGAEASGCFATGFHDWALVGTLATGPAAGPPMFNGSGAIGLMLSNANSWGELEGGSACLSGNYYAVGGASLQACAGLKDPPTPNLDFETFEEFLDSLTGVVTVFGGGGLGASADVQLFAANTKVTSSSEFGEQLVYVINLLLPCMNGPDLPTISVGGHEIVDLPDVGEVGCT